MDIVEEIRKDPENGAKRLVSEYKAGLLSLARRFCNDSSDAEELVNRTFAEVVANIERYAEQSAFFGWMCQILSNLHANDCRRKAISNTVYPGNVPDVADEKAQDEIFSKVDHDLLREAIEGLPEDTRKAVVMHYFMDMPVREMARILKTPMGTIARRLHCARAMLAAKLGVVKQKPGGKALLLALALAALTAAGAAGVAAVRFVAGAAAVPAAESAAGQPQEALESLEVQESLEPLASLEDPTNLEPRTANHETTTNLNTNNEEITMNTKSVKSAAAKALAAGAMLAATAPAMSAGSARADSINNYLQLQYLASSGAQAIDTGVKFGRYTRMSFRMKVTGGATGGQIGVIDSFGTDGKYDRFHFNVNDDKLRVWCDRRDEGIGSVHAVGGTWHNYDINLVDNKVYRDGTQDILAATNPEYVGTTNNHSTIWLFGRNSNTPSLKQYATIYLSKVEIWQDGRETYPDRSLVPCKRLSDNALGMYDTVKNEFLTNVGTGTFVPGPGSLDYDEIPLQILNDEPVCPEVVVKAGGHRLVKDTDYTLAWMDNTDTGLGKVTVTPIGSYADCAVFAVQFLIVPKEKTLPPEYQRIAYIESTSGGMQQLDTLVHPNGNMRVDIKFQSPIPNAMGQVGMIDDVGSVVERFHMGKGDRIYGGIGNKYSPGFDYSTVVGDNWALMMLRTRLENNVPCGWFVLNETNIDKMTDIGTFRADNTTFGLFGRLSNNNNYKTYAAYRVMYMEVKEGDEQVQTHRFVPCRRIADGELGVYDTVANQFLYDTGRAARGAAAFLAGPVVGDEKSGGGMILFFR